MTPQRRDTQIPRGGFRVYSSGFGALDVGSFWDAVEILQGLYKDCIGPT